MQIMIEISDTLKKIIDSHDILTASHPMWVAIMMDAIENGTPLPKGHGRLIDADEYKEHLYACETNGRPLYIMELDERLATVDEAPTIIEADSEVNNGK